MLEGIDARSEMVMDVSINFRQMVTEETAVSPSVGNRRASCKIHLTCK